MKADQSETELWKHYAMLEYQHGPEAVRREKAERAEATKPPCPRCGSENVYGRVCPRCGPVHLLISGEGR